MSRQKLPLWMWLLFAFCVISWAIMIALALAGPEMTTRAVPDTNGWPEGAEFSTLESGQARFSSHSCGDDLGGVVVVDHLTGVQYLMSGTGMCPLLDADGSPLLVAEAGDGR